MLASSFQLGYPPSSTTFYHIHLSTHQEENLLGDLSDEETALNPSGQIAACEWRQMAIAHQRDILLDHWAVWPNGVRALVAVVHGEAPRSLSQSSPKPRALSSFVAGFKAAAAKRINLSRGIPGAPVWQRGYQEQRINDPRTLKRIRQLLTRQAQSAGLVETGPYIVPSHRVPSHTASRHTVPSRSGRLVE